MHVFVTGATGYLAGAIIRELQHAHDVTGLTRTEEGAAALEDMGVRPVIGDVVTPEGWRSAAEEADALIHAAEDPDDPAGADRAAVDALLQSARSGSARAVIYTSGCWMLGDTGAEPVAEDAPVDRPAAVARYRAAHEQMVLEAGTEELATAVIRPMVVYGGKQGLVGAFFRSAEESGAAKYVGPGDNRWSLVYRDDVARLYHLVLEGGARGIFHAAEGTAMPVKDIAQACSRAAGFGGTTRSIPLEEARAELGAAADALALDQRVTARRSTQIGWKPRHTGFRDSVERVYREWRGS